MINKLIAAAVHERNGEVASNGAGVDPAGDTAGTIDDLN